jgi:hypothetical protein
MPRSASLFAGEDILAVHTVSRAACRTLHSLTKAADTKAALEHYIEKIEFNQCDAAIISQIALYGDATDHINAQKQRNEPRGELPAEPPKPHTLRWYWTLYKQSDHWLGDLSAGYEGLSDSTRLQRTGLIESLLPENGEKPFAVLTRNVIRAEMKARTPSQAGNLLSALRGMFRWMIDEGHLEQDDDPAIGLKSGKAKASRETGGFLPWTDDDMARYRAKWPLGTEARLIFDILHYTFLRLGDAHRFGPPHLRQIVRQMAVRIATEKSRGNTTVTVPVHPQFAESLQAARAAGIIGAEVFTGKLLRASTSRRKAVTACARPGPRSPHTPTAPRAR